MDRLRDLCKTALFILFLRQAQISILKIFNIFLWLKFSPSLNSNKNYPFSKVSLINIPRKMAPSFRLFFCQYIESCCNPECLFFWFFSNLVGEEGPGIPGVKDSRVCFLKTLSALSTFFRFPLCLCLVYPISLFQLNLNPLLIISVFQFANRTIRYAKHPNIIHSCLSSFGNFAVILYISKQSRYDFCQTFNSL